MNKYAMMLVAAGLIAAAPAYYAFQAQAEEAPAAEEMTVPADDSAAAEDMAAPAAEAQEPAAGEEAPMDMDHNAPAEAAE